MLAEDHRGKKIILASTSPRRKKIFELLGLDFEVIKPVNYVEKKFRNPYHTAVFNSINKAKNVQNYVKINKLEKVKDYNKNNFLIAGFDTIVYLGRKYLGKPYDNEEALQYLKLLSGRTHLVITGVCIFDSNNEKYLYGSEATKVRFRNLCLNEIRDYLGKEYVLDKAGAYNIYGFGSVLVKKIDGCFFNVAGIPVSLFINLLKKFDFKIIG